MAKKQRRGGLECEGRQVRDELALVSAATGIVNDIFVGLLLAACLAHDVERLHQLPLLLTVGEVIVEFSHSPEQSVDVIEV